MIIEIRETWVYTAKIDPMDVVRAYPVEWIDFLGDAAQTGGWGEDDVKDFISESAREVGADLFLELNVAPEREDEMEISFL